MKSVVYKPLFELALCIAANPTKYTYMRNLTVLTLTFLYDAFDIALSTSINKTCKFVYLVLF